ncbi:uncharacterized protein SAPINGB_P001522 [Magnusiomyces paraingens]|uniref:Uncharacterized protein n=1 Tax=Magnusiomyces paraingens TaxID=2606893 RepID=A0A5E8B660_9ASCO|nr:uncharacterized protein SAPINGB_P001522 [Saprochaete ingens]VVT47057.1 unnamed protein product [Saprochaete ingens]
MTIADLYPELSRPGSQAKRVEAEKIPIYPIFDGKGRQVTDACLQLEVSKIGVRNKDEWSNASDSDSIDTNSFNNSTLLTMSTISNYTESTDSSFNKKLGNGIPNKQKCEEIKLTRYRGAADPQSIASRIASAVAHDQYPVSNSRTFAGIGKSQQGTRMALNGYVCSFQKTTNILTKSKTSAPEPTKACSGFKFPPPPKRAAPQNKLNNLSAYSCKVLQLKSQYVFRAGMNEEISSKGLKWMGTHAHKNASVGDYFKLGDLTDKSTKGLGDMSYDMETVYARLEKERELREELDEAFSLAIKQAIMKKSTSAKKSQKKGGLLGVFAIPKSKNMAEAPLLKTKSHEDRLFSFLKDKFSQVHVFKKTGSGRFYLMSNGDFVSLQRVIVDEQEELLRAGICAAIEEVGLAAVLALPYHSLTSVERRVFGGIVAMARVYGMNALQTIIDSDQQRIAQIYRNEVKRYGIMHILEGTQPSKTSDRAKLAILGETETK